MPLRLLLMLLLLQQLLLLLLPDSGVNFVDSLTPHLVARSR
ncbi:hypothetical protein [Rhodocyclus gracilis]|nr:hypothetical protein [Rhodocyclus gracilis]